MATTVAQLADALQMIFTTVANDAAVASGFIQRQGKLTGAAWVQGLVFGWLANPRATVAELAQNVQEAGVALSPQALDQRWSPAAADCLQRVLSAAVQQVVTADPAASTLLQRFAAVEVQDSTTVTLPAAHAAAWPACGGGAARDPQRRSRAALKLQVRVNLCSGQLTGPLPQAGRAADVSCSLQADTPAPNTLRLADMGYFDLDVLQRLGQHQSWWLSRLPVNTAVFVAGTQLADLSEWLERQPAGPVDVAIDLGADHRLQARLLAVRVPRRIAQQRRKRLRQDARRKGRKVSQLRWRLAAWTVLVTNLPATLASVAEALVLQRARWQIELLFKLWKEHGLLDEWRSANAQRILCEVFAKLLGLVVQHWLLLLGCWRHSDRSVRKAAQRVRRLVVLVAVKLADRDWLLVALEVIQGLLAASVTERLNPRRKRPNTCQLLDHPELLAKLLDGGLAA